MRDQRPSQRTKQLSDGIWSSARIDHEAVRTRKNGIAFRKPLQILQNQPKTTSPMAKPQLAFGATQEFDQLVVPTSAGDGTFGPRHSWTSKPFRCSTPNLEQCQDQTSPNPEVRHHEGDGPNRKGCEALGGQAQTIHGLSEASVVPDEERTAFNFSISSGPSPNGWALSAKTSEASSPCGPAG